MKHNSRLSILSILATTLLFSLVFSVSNAAELFFGIDMKKLNISDVFTVNVLLDTQGENVNAVEGKLVFPGDLLEIKSINFKDGSIINIWAQEPTAATITKEEAKEVYSEVSFSGGVTGGYKGKTGKVFDVSFMVKANGQGALKLNNAKVLLNDGKATAAKLKLTDYNFKVGGLTYEEEQEEAKYLLKQVPSGEKNKIKSASKCGFVAMDGYFADPKVDKNKKKSAYFKDINDGGSKLVWCAAAADYYYDRKIIQGRSSGIFGVKGTINRYEVATIVARQLTQASNEKLDDTSVTPFIDDKSIPAWARGSVAYLNKKGIFKGFDLKDGTFKFGGDQNIINIDAAIVLHRTFAGKK